MSKLTKTTRMTTTIVGATLAAAVVLLSLGAARAEVPAEIPAQGLGEAPGIHGGYGFIDETGARCYVFELEAGGDADSAAPGEGRLQVICGAGGDTQVV